MNRKIKILIVDDSSINRQILSALFDTDYEILEADDGTTALQVLSAHAVDIIILDIIMPQMDGLEFLQRIKQDPRYKYISVIISTEAGSTENELRALQLGADNFIAKPYNPIVIQYRVKNLVETYIERHIMLEKSLLETEKIFHSTIEAIPGGVGIFKKTDGYCLSFADDKLSEMLGYTSAEASGMLGADALAFISEADRERVRQQLDKEELPDEAVSFCVELLHKNGSMIEAEMSIKSADAEGGGHFYYAVITNVTASKENLLKKELSRYQYRAGRDSLTGIYNMDHFVKRTALLIEQHPNEKFVVGKWNIDRFKAVNELFGSRTGDRIICAFSDYLKQTYTWPSTYGRMEADHFVTCCTESFLEEHADEIDALLAGELPWHTLNYPISLHVGFYRAEPEDRDIAIMCDRAGMALQSIKDGYLQRQNYFNAQLRETLVKEQQMMRDIDKALQEKEFFVMYQPVVDAATGGIISAEALVRWNQGDAGIVSPNEFIPIFEKNGFISKLDMYVWEEVCIYQSRRRQAGKRIVPVSVNLSRVDFYNINLLKDIMALLKKYKLDADCLRIEITESAYMDQPQELMTAIQQFQKNGFKVLMDDFGSGYSSLNMLKDVSVDILKIDMRFMESLETSDRAGNILFSIIQMAKAIHMEIIVEGVETANQYELLVSMDCDDVQGYYFYRPLPAEEFGCRLDEEATNIEDQESKRRPAILLVDDVELERELLCKIIGDEYEIFTAAGVDEALELLKNKFSDINLIISDMIMPEKNGFELLRQVKRMLFLKDIPVLMATAYGEYENIRMALSMGALDVVTKPYDPPLLRQRLRNILKISERETTQREIYAIRENVVFRKQLDSLLENSIAGIGRIKLSRDGKLSVKELSYVNERFLYYHQMPLREAQLKATLPELMWNAADSDKASISKMLADAVEENRKYVQREYRIEWGNGACKNMLANCTLQYGRDQILLDMIIVECKNYLKDQPDKMAQDITDEKIGRKIRWREQQYREIFSKEAELFAEADLTDNRFISEESYQQFSRFGVHEEVSYDTLLEAFLGAVNEEDAQYCRSMLDRIHLLNWYEAGEREVKFDFLSNANEAHLYEWYTSSMFLVKNGEDKHVYASWQIKNIQREKQRTSNIQRLAERDTLTGLYNRIMIEKSMDMTLAAVNRKNILSAFLVIDVDNFKAVNDNFGHDFGDSMLRAIAKLLSQTFRAEDIVARIGSDEFAVFLPRVASKDWILRRAQEICESSVTKLDNQGSAICVSCSVGIAFSGENGKSFRELYPKADAALDQAKKGGKNCFAVYEMN